MVHVGCGGFPDGFWDDGAAPEGERAETRRDPRESDGTPLRVATWNLKRLGHGDKRLDRIAPIMDGFDVVAVQEVMSRDAVGELLEHLPGWKAEISARAVGRGRYTEWYAVLYRPERVAVERAFMLDDARDAFAREPLVVCMRAGDFDFCLVVMHVIYGREARARDAEIDALGARLATLRADSAEKDWIVVGDFNRMPRAPGWDRLRRAGWSFAAGGEVATSVGKGGYRNAYDHILVDTDHTLELDGKARRVDFVARACASDFDACSVDVSDHAPVTATFRVTGPDDD